MTNDQSIAWLTDLHLEFVEPAEIDLLLDGVRQADPKAVLIGGDIGQAHHVVDLLSLIDNRLQRPVYFVLGNHDFYHGSIAQVRSQVVGLCQRRPRLTYLTEAGSVALSESVGLVGHDGWADGRIGDYFQSPVALNDYRLIEELAGRSKAERLPLLQALGAEAAAHIRHVLPAALEAHSEVLLLTHVPPLRQACWYQGRTADDHWAPHFTCGAMGDAILELMPNYPDHKLTVLCGHTHHPGQVEPLPNVLILTAGAQYGQPNIARMFDLSGQ